MIRVILFCSAFFLLTLPTASASHMEYELFDRAYEFYLGYQPERAAETFRAFLSQFPESSAKDAALFWLGKSLARTDVAESKRIFYELRRQFPESPMVPFVNREVENLALAEGLNDAAGKDEMLSSAAKKEDGRDNGPKEADKEVRLLEEQLARAASERDRLVAMLEEEKRNAENAKSAVRELEKREIESRALLARMEEQHKRTVNELESHHTQFLENKGRPEAIMGSLQGGNTQTETEKTDMNEAAGHRKLLVRIGGEKYTIEQVLDFMITSSLALSKGGVRDIVWRSGSLFEDFINEQVLYGEAKRQNVAPDTRKQKELSEKFGLTAEEADYLGRCLAVSDLIDRKVGTLPEERVVEALTVRYTEKDKQEKVMLANELQSQAKSGKSFEELSGSFPGKTRFSVVGFQELQGWIKERIELLQDGEVSVVWTKDGYMILRPAVKKASYRPFEETAAGKNNEIRSFVRKWLDELREQIREIEIFRMR
jgi:hypothetical protein